MNSPQDFDAFWADYNEVISDTQKRARAAMDAAHKTMARTANLSRVRAELEAQDEKWGETDHPAFTGPKAVDRSEYFDKGMRDAYNRELNDVRHANDIAKFTGGEIGWDTILREEVLESLTAETTADMKKELIQVAATALAWLEDIERQERNDRESN